MKHVQVELKFYLTLKNGHVCQDGKFREYSESKLLDMAREIIQKAVPFCDAVRPVGVNFTGVENE